MERGVLERRCRRSQGAADCSGTLSSAPKRRRLLRTAVVCSESPRFCRSQDVLRGRKASPRRTIFPPKGDETLRLPSSKAALLDTAGSKPEFLRGARKARPVRDFVSYTRVQQSPAHHSRRAGPEPRPLGTMRRPRCAPAGPRARSGVPGRRSRLVRLWAQAPPPSDGRNSQREVIAVAIFGRASWPERLPPSYHGCRLAHTVCGSPLAGPKMGCPDEGTITAIQVRAPSVWT